MQDSGGLSLPGGLTLTQGPNGYVSATGTPSAVTGDFNSRVCTPLPMRMLHGRHKFLQRAVCMTLAAADCPPVHGSCSTAPQTTSFKLWACQLPSHCFAGEAVTSPPTPAPTEGKAASNVSATGKSPPPVPGG